MKTDIYNLSYLISRNELIILELHKSTNSRPPFEIEVNRVAELELENYKLKKDLNQILASLHYEFETK